MMTKLVIAEHQVLSKNFATKIDALDRKNKLYI